MAGPNPFQRFGGFLGEVREEVKLVSWPTRDELVGSALVVFVGVTFLALYIAFWDVLLSNITQRLLRSL